MNQSLQLKAQNCGLKRTVCLELTEVVQQRQPGGDATVVIEPRFQKYGHKGRIWDVMLTETIIATASEDCTCRLWSQVDGAPLQCLKAGSIQGCTLLLGCPNFVFCCIVGTLFLLWNCLCPLNGPALLCSLTQCCCTRKQFLKQASGYITTVLP